MRNSLLIMTTRVLRINLIVSVAAGLVLAMIFNLESGIVFIIGAIVSSVNFTVSALVTNHTVTGRISAIWGLLSYLVRILAVAVIGGLFFRYDRFFVIFYIAGFLMHFVALLIYALQIKDERE